MDDPSRNNLMIREWGEYDPTTNRIERTERIAQDDDLRRLGYVRLDTAPTTQGLVSTQEIAQRLHVKKETVHAWRYRGVLPEPDFDLAVGPVWLWGTIQEWAEETGRL